MQSKNHSFSSWKTMRDWISVVADGWERKEILRTIRNVNFASFQNKLGIFGVR